MNAIRIDLSTAYILTGLFGAAIRILSSDVLYKGGIQVSGKEGVLKMAQVLGGVAGEAGRWIFLVGF